MDYGTKRIRRLALCFLLFKKEADNFEEKKEDEEDGTFVRGLLLCC